MNNNSLQGDLQEAIRNALNCANSFEGDLYALCNLYGVADGAVSGRLIPVAQKHSPTIGTASGALNYLLQNPTVLPSMGLNFVDGTDRLDSRVTFTRASNAWRFNSAGVLTQATTNTPRFDYDPSTLAPRGLLIEEQRTNSIRNNTMVGAVAGVVGSGGSFPTNWSSSLAVDGLTLTVGTPSTESGINYVDVRINGTASTARTNISAIAFEVSNNIAAASGQTWTGSSYVKQQAGSTSNITNIGIQLSERDAAGNYLVDTTNLITPTSAALSGQRNSVNRTLNNASTAFVRLGVTMSYSASAAIDVTLRIGLPQLEQGAFATSVIPTSGAAATRAADVAQMLGTNFSSWYNQTEGTLFAEAQVPTDRNYSGTFRSVVNCTPASSSNSSVLLLVTSTQGFSLDVRDGGVAQANLTSGTNTGSSSKWAGAYKVNDFGLSVKGATAVTDTSGSAPTSDAPTQMTIGRTRDGNVLGILNGWVSRIAYYPRRLANAELQGITA